MSTLINKISTRIPSQLPEFVRDDLNYETFVAFVEAYYEWLELINTSNSSATIVSTTQQGPTYALKNLLDYSDIDKTLDEFIQYYLNEFLPNFPETSLADKTEIVKLARELYKTKGTPASYKLLFRILYNSEAELLYTRDLVFKPSTSEWYIPKYLKIQSFDLNWLSSSLKNLRLFGTQSKSFAVIENNVATTSGDKFNIYISQIERLFISGETLRVIDSARNTVYFKDGNIVPEGTPGSSPLEGQIIGTISNIDINRKFRGLKYKVGDPVVVYGGVADPSTAVRAVAEVAETTQGSIQRLNILDGGFGYRVDPNTRIVFTGGGGSGAIAHVQTVNTVVGSANVTYVGSDIIALRQHIRLDASQYNFASNVNANNLCTLANAFTFQSFETYPIDSVIVDNGGGGYSSVPQISAESLYFDDLPSQDVWIKDGVIYTEEEPGSIKISSNTHLISSTGILSPIQIVSTGVGYQANDKIVFSGGSGVGAFANVTSVTLQGAIESIDYVPNYLDGNIYPLGGMGYTNELLPNVHIQSSNVNAYGASIFVPGILGTGAKFTALTDRIGSITRIGILNNGEDYISTPSVSFRVQDLVITNVSDIQSITPELQISQGLSQTYTANVDSLLVLKSTPNPQNDVYRLRVYNYKGVLDYNQVANVITSTSNVTFNLSNEFDAPGFYQNGVFSYGNGTAKGTARFLSGLIYGEGRYLDFVSHPSNYSVLQSDIHNDYTYILSVEKPISIYRDTLKSLIHPAGMRVIGRSLLKSEKSFEFGGYRGLGLIQPLQYWIGYPVGDATASITMQVEANNLSSNVLTVNSIVEDGIFDNISNNDIIIIDNGKYDISSKIDSLDGANSKIYLQEHIWLKFPNVAFAYTDNLTNKIVISESSRKNTPNYDIVNNREYSNTENHIEDIIFVGDELTINNTSYIVRNIDYVGNIISVDKELGLLALETGDNLLVTEDGNNNILLGDYILQHGTEQNPLPITINRTINSSKVYIKKLE